MKLKNEEEKRRIDEILDSLWKTAALFNLTDDETPIFVRNFGYICQELNRLYKEKEN